MKLALINPRGIVIDSEKIFSGSSALKNYNHLMSVFNMWSGLNLGLLIASITPDTFEIEVIDDNFEEIDFQKHFDLVAITGNTQQIDRAYEIADNYRKRGSTVVLGGIHTSLMPYEAKKHADSVFIGECENTWPVFIKNYLNNCVKNFYICKHRTNLREAVIPRYDLIKEEYYKTIWLQVGRGCPRDCIFCATTKLFGKEYRHKTIDRVIKEIEFIKSLSRKQISFADDNLFLHKKFSRDLLKELVSLGVKWFAQTDISVADDEHLLRLLHESGCNTLFIGFESLSAKNLRGLDRSDWKLKHLNKYKKSVKRIQSYGIGVMGGFIFGFDNDDISIFKDTIDFIIDTNLYASQFTILTPLPGTKLRECMNKTGRLFNYDWSYYTFLNVTFQPLLMSPEELYEGTFRAYRAVYSKEVRIKVAKYFKQIFAQLAAGNPDKWTFTQSFPY